jgi:chorismate dehydratase
MKSRLAAFDASYLKPLLFGLDRPEGPFDLQIDIPARNTLKLRDRAGNTKCAFLTPIDYARHGAEYCIVPDVCASSSQKTDTVRLVLKSELRNIERIAVDIRFTSEVILAKIILMEKYRNFPSSRSNLVFIPMMPDVVGMLAKADAALVVSDTPQSSVPAGSFAMDLVEEWTDMTDLPYVFGFWVGREEELTQEEARALHVAKRNGVNLRTQIADAFARQNNLSVERMEKYISSFSYDFGEREEKGLAEFIELAYYHGVIGDIPEIRFFDLQSGPGPAP